MEETETAPVRWYKDTPSVPYMGIREYYEMLFGEQLDLKAEGHGNLASGLPPFLAVKEETKEQGASPAF